MVIDMSCLFQFFSLLGVLMFCIWKFFPMITLNLNINVKQAIVVIASLVLWVGGNFFIVAILKGTLLPTISPPRSRIR